ncbi:Alpha/beta hydrolase family-domain-containing protein [Crepidotus variabilis]|uniref:Alpha/beta hydrolase family-domain-containing protein n=1 Tax=Crepidotus variabilis TaxID=179855 RepID=A0A9P6JJG1_9AGAR|nr:Alpha/beta hydrolase family-domain-containing protein [Crepidotus variabilis]
MVFESLNSYPEIPVQFSKLSNLRSVLPIYPPAEPLERPNGPLPVRRLDFNASYTVTRHLVPACFIRTARPVPLPSPVPLSATKEERKQLLEETYDFLVRARGDPSKETDGYPQVTWNCINRYIKKNNGSKTQDGRGITLLLAHATGFPKEIWEPMLSHLLSSEAASLIDEVWSWEAFQHGDSCLLNAKATSAVSDWTDNSRDIVNFLSNFLPDESSATALPVNLLRIPSQESKDRLTDGFKNRKIVVVGHSYGGASMALAACAFPALFTSLILVDPVITEPHETAQKGKALDLAKSALNRREEWPSREEALNAFLKNPFFRAWDPAVLQVYVECGLYTTDAGTVRLKTPSVLEASLFTETYTSQEIFQRLPALDDKIPLRWIIPGKPGGSPIGGPGDTARRVWVRPRNSTNVKIFEAGHLIPHEAPKELAEDLASYLLRCFTPETLLQLKPSL